jgi:hypothetical protein
VRSDAQRLDERQGIVAQVRRGMELPSRHLEELPHAAVAVHPQNLQVLATVRPPEAAGTARAAVQIWLDSASIPDFETVDVTAERHDFDRQLVSEDAWVREERLLPAPGVYVGSTHAHPLNSDQRPIGPRRRGWVRVDQPKLARAIQNNCAHSGRYDSRMTSPTAVEAWLRGPVEGVPPLLMPVAHALLHAREDATRALTGLTPEQIWASEGGASVGFHVRHLAGALDRLLTYARGEGLTPEQRRAAASEAGRGDPPADASSLIADLERAIDRALMQVRSTSPDTLLDARPVGRQQLPSTVLGVLFHAAEHAARHAGQAITIARRLHNVAG